MGYGRYSEGRTRLYDRMKLILAANTILWIDENVEYVHGAAILEIGVGKGEMQRHFEQRGETHGQDVSEECLKHAKRPHNIALPGIPMAMKSLGLIYAAHVMEHLPDYKTCLQTMRVMRHCLHTLGSIVLIIPDYMSWKEDFWNVDYTHAVPFSDRRMKQLVQDAGMHIAKTETICGPFLGLPAKLLDIVNHALPWRSIHPRLRQAGFTLHRDRLYLIKKSD